MLKFFFDLLMVIFENLIWQLLNFVFYINFIGLGEECFDVRREGEYIVFLVIEIFMKKIRGRLFSVDVVVVFFQFND